MALRNVKAQQYVRTNQFEVESRLNGLIEKFQVLNRDDLADALQARLTELSNIRNKWTPEILHLLLELSDRPVEKTELEDLYQLEQHVTTTPELTWADIIADDPLTDEELWRDVSFSPGSSEDEIVLVSSPSRRTKRSPQKPISDQHDQPNLKAAIVPIDIGQLDVMKCSQFWRSTHPQECIDVRLGMGSTVSEIQVTRECILMLRGLPTILFMIKGSKVSFSGRYQLPDIQPSTFEHAMSSFARIGSQLLHLRLWLKKSRKEVLLQAFQASLGSRIRQYDKKLTEIESRLVAPDRPVTVSILSILEDVKALARPLLRLEEIVRMLSDSDRSFLYLELLYETICNTQAVGQFDLFEPMKGIFFEDLEVYLKPVRLWMEQGELIGSDSSFFIARSDDENLAHSWHGYYFCRTGDDDRILAPSFLHPAGRSILNAGKSIVFLRKIGYTGNLVNSTNEPRLDKSTPSGNIDEFNMIAFSEAFSASFDSWIRSKYGPASSILTQRLRRDCGLERYLDSLALIYLSRDGVLFQEFADQVFQRLDRWLGAWNTSCRTAWNDCFLLTELIQRVFASHMDAKGLSITINPVKFNRQSVKPLSSIEIGINIPWPISEIIPYVSLQLYRRVFTLLLQIYRAKYLLRQENAMIRHFGSDKTTVSLKQRLTWFVDNLQTYVLEVVLLPAMDRLRRHTAQAEDLDALLQAHESFTDKIQTQCLLTKNVKPIHESLISVLDLAVQYSNTRTRHLYSLDITSILKERTKHRKGPEARHTPKHQQQHDSDSNESSEGPDTTDDEANDDGPETRSSSYQDQLATMSRTFTDLCNFTVAGLRGISRTAGETCWEILAERLELR